MTISVSKSVLKPKLLNYLRQIEKTKESILVTDRGHPVAKIVPYADGEKTVLQELKGSVMFYDNPLEPVGIADWELGS